jgi:hypothetical protein
MLTATNKRLLISESLVIQIDVHPAGENLINMTRTLPMPVQVRHTYVSYERSP